MDFTERKLGDNGNNDRLENIHCITFCSQTKRENLIKLDSVSEARAVLVKAYFSLSPTVTSSEILCEIGAVSLQIRCQPGFMGSCLYRRRSPWSGVKCHPKLDFCSLGSLTRLQLSKLHNTFSGSRGDETKMLLVLRIKTPWLTLDVWARVMYY